MSADAVQMLGYEIHAGITTGIEVTSALIQTHNKKDGVLSEDRQIMATYLHGIFDHPEACDYLLLWAGLETSKNTKKKYRTSYDYRDLQEQGINLLADTLEAHLDINSLMDLVQKQN